MQIDPSIFQKLYFDPSNFLKFTNWAVLLIFNLVQKN